MHNREEKAGSALLTSEKSENPLDQKSSCTNNVNKAKNSLNLSDSEEIIKSVQQSFMPELEESTRKWRQFDRTIVRKIFQSVNQRQRQKTNIKDQD